MPEKSLASEAAFRALRRRAREVVLQVLYQEDLNPQISPTVGDQILENAFELTAILRPCALPSDAGFAEPSDVDAEESVAAARAALWDLARQEVPGEDAGRAAALSPGELLALTRDRLTDFSETAAGRFARTVLSGVRQHRGGLDRLIEQTARNWSLERIAPTDRNILRLGAYEILHCDTPPIVAIDEAVELAKRFGTAQSAQFVNGILDKVMNEKDKVRDEG